MFGDVFAGDGASCCDACGDNRCGTSTCMPLGCGIYVRADYLLWGLKGMRLLPLVTTGDPATQNPPPGVINEDGSLPSNTTVLFGNGRVNSQAHSGGRIVFGNWMNVCWGWEGEYYGLSDERTAFVANSTGDTLLAIPFFDETSSGLPATFVVAPGAGGPPGTIAVDVATRFQGAGFRLLRNLCCWDGCGPGWWDGCPVPLGKRVDLLVGYRFNRLDDEISIAADHDILGTSRFGRDFFDSENQFHGLDLGTLLQFRRGRCSLDLVTKVAIGNTRSTVLIGGIAFQDDVQQTPAGSILALSSNSGRHVHHNFSMIPELGANFGYQINPCWRVTCGYSLIYWSGVYRAGEQIDLHVNPDLWPPLPLTGNTAGLWPQYPGRCTDFWAQGINFGLEARW